MTILVDGASDPTKITFNGYRISRVLCDGVEVWPCFPSISSTVTVSYGTAAKFYFNDFMLKRRVADATGVYAEYECTISADMSWSRYSTVQTSNGLWLGGFQPDNSSGCSVSGLPSGLSFLSFEYGTVNLTLVTSTSKESTPYSIAYADFTLASGWSLFSWVDWNSFKSTYGIDESNFWVGVATTGFVGQKANCTLKVRKS